jgi:hypothetical protein
MNNRNQHIAHILKQLEYLDRTEPKKELEETAFGGTHDCWEASRERCLRALMVAMGEDHGVN